MGPTQIIGLYFFKDNGKRLLLIQDFTQKYWLNFFLLILNVDVSEKCGFNNIDQLHTQLIPQRKFFTKNSLDVSLYALGTFRGLHAFLTWQYVIFLWVHLK